MVANKTAGVGGREAVSEAVWIGVEGLQLKHHDDYDDANNPPRETQRWLAFRKTLAVGEVRQTVKTRIAADSKYWLWINGVLVVFEGQLKRGPTPRDTYCDEVELSPYLKRGANTVAVLVWYFGKNGFSHLSSGQAGLFFEARAGDLSVVSDGTWKAIQHPAYGDTVDGEQPNFRLPESNILFDARKDVAGWQQPGFDDRAWPQATSFGAPPVAPWNGLMTRPIPLWKDFGLRDFVNTTETTDEHGNRTVVAKLPYNAQITPYVHVRARAGDRIGLRTDNSGMLHEKSVRAEYIARDGEQEYESLGWMNGHECRFVIPDGVEILKLKYRETGYDTGFVGKFHCDDPFLNKLRQKALRTLYVTMRDTYMDCPDRERAQWWGDEVNEMGEAFYALDARSTLLAKKGFLELAGWQWEDGVVHAPVPGNYKSELPMQMLNTVGYYGLWTYLLYSGDIETVRDVYPAVRRYLEVWRIGDDGLVVPRAGGWTWGDWGDNKDMTVLYNCWFFLALKGQLKVVEALGLTDESRGIQARMRCIEEHFNPAFWTGSCYRSKDYDGEIDDRANALAVLCSLAGPDKYPAIAEVLGKETHSSPYLEKYVVEALYVMDNEEQAVERTKVRFKEMVEHAYTTLWEGWDIGSDIYGGGSVNHAWSGGPLTLLSQYAAGVSPLEPGYRRFQVVPQMRPLNLIDAVVPTPQGLIEVHIRRGEGRFEIALTTPAHSEATVGIPKRDVGPAPEIILNDSTVSPGDSDGRYWRLTLPAGTHRIEARAHSTHEDRHPPD